MGRIALMLLALAELIVGLGFPASVASPAGRCRAGELCRSVPGAGAIQQERSREYDPVGFDAAKRRAVRPRIVVHAAPRYSVEEPGAIYGYSPGYYRQGWDGMLYGPYPLNPNAPVAELRY